MSADLPPALWKKLTSTVGLVAVPGERGTNVMACEWAYFVNKEPLYVAVVLGPRTASRDLIAAAGRFAVTFCADDQAELADFAGSCTVGDVDKATSEAIRFGAGAVTPWVTGGVLAVECELRQTVDLPVHRMYVGEVVAAHLPDRSNRPLVKHGGMYTLGEAVQRTAVVTATRLLTAGALRVAATGPPTESPAPWRISLVAADGEATDLGEHAGDQYGDLLVDLPLPTTCPAGYRIRVERDGAKPGYAVIAP
jgi:flavin reductase (DIM6/NTAB) family NADH-FMN oxidoreductase RutF